MSEEISTPKQAADLLIALAHAHASSPRRRAHGYELAFHELSRAESRRLDAAASDDDEDVPIADETVVIRAIIRWHDVETVREWVDAIAAEEDAIAAEDEAHFAEVTRALAEHYKPS